MKANPHTAKTIRSLIRWATGTATTAAIMVTGCTLFPLLGSFSAFSMTLCFALYIGLQIALPPVDEEDDWVPVRANMEEDTESTFKEKQESTVIAFPVQVRRAV